MATPMTDVQFVAALRAEGLPVVEIPGWTTNNRAGHGAWGPLNGVIIHHTGSEVANTQAQTYAAGTLFRGYSTLPGPLCQSGEAPDGRIFMVGNGRCNHAGGGDQASLNAVIADAAPMNGELHPKFGNLNGVDGNAHFYGLEVMRSGSLPWPSVQYTNAVKWATAICRFHRWTAASVIGHKEWSSDKPDPGLTDMGAFRAAVAAALALPAGKWPAAPKPAPKDWFTMATSADLQAAVKAQLDVYLPRLAEALRTGRPNTTNPPSKSFTYVDNKGLDGELADLSAKVDALTAAVAALTPPPAA